MVSTNKFTIVFLRNYPEVLSLSSNRVKLLSDIVSKNSNLDDSDNAYMLSFPTPKLLKKVLTDLDLKSAWSWMYFSCHSE